MSHEFSDGKGHPLIGPGAQMHVTYNGAGKVVQLHHSARELKEGPAVPVFSDDEARSRVAHQFPRDARINLWLVYWCPSLGRGPGHNQSLSPQHIIPCYAYNSVVSVTDVQTGTATERRTKIQLIPATDDPRFVPTVNLRVSGRDRVDAVAEVSGGRGPYSYVWSGSNPEVSGQAGPSVSYTPISRAAVPAGSARRRLVDRRETVGVTAVHASLTLRLTGSAGRTAWRRQAGEAALKSSRG